MEVHFVEESAIHGSTLYVEGPEARHIVKVLRHKPGDELRFTDGRGRFIDARIDRCDPKGVHAEITSAVDDPRERGAPWSNLGLSLLKGDHFEIALEKSVELGVHRLVPLIADHCVVKLKASAEKRKLERWQRIADSAMKQSGRSWRCQIVAPMTVEDAVDEFGHSATLIVADEAVGGSDDHGLRAGEPHFGLVGPEGAFSAREKEWLQERGARRISLGPFRLRSETAAIVLAATLNRGRYHE